MDDELEEKVKSWLDGQGYPLEFRVAREFAAAGFDVRTGHYYRDPDSAEPREIDVLATLQRGSSSVDRPDVSVSFVIECKTSKLPLVLFAPPSPSIRPSITDRVFHSRWQASADRMQRARRASYDRRQDLSYSGVVAKLSKNPTTGSNFDVFYNATISVIKAAYAWALEWHENDQKCPHIVFPAIVFGAPIFLGSLSAQGDTTELRRVENGAPLLSSRPLKGRRTTLIDVVADASLKTYVDECKDLVHDMVALLRRG